MLDLKVLAAAAVVACVLLVGGCIIYQSEKEPVGENELVANMLHYNEFSGMGELVSIFENKAVYRIDFERPWSIGENENIIHVDNYKIIYARDNNNLSVPEIIALFNQTLEAKHIMTRTREITFSDKSYLTDEEFEDLLETIDSSGFLTFENIYNDWGGVDSDEVFLTINLDGGLKTVNVYNYGGSGAPDGFHRIDYVIWGIVRQKWGPSLLPPPDVVINEIYESGDGPTWYELYNLTDSTLDTSKWRFASRSTGYVHLPMDNMLPGEYVILCDSKEQFKNRWSLPEGIRCFEFVAGAPGGLLLLDNTTSNELGVVERISERSVLEPGHSWSRYVGGYYTDSWSRYMGSWSRYVGSYGADNYFANYFYDESHPTPGRPNSKVKGEGGVEGLAYGIVGIIIIVIIWTYARARK